MVFVAKFYEFLLQLYSRYKSVQKGSEEELIDLQNDVIKYLRRINDNSLREICIFVADDFLIKKYEWKNFLIEKVLLKSSSGGSIFFEKFDQYLSNGNYEMCVVCLLAIKTGFTGYISDISDKYNSYYSKFKTTFNVKESVPEIRNYENLGYTSGVNLASIIIPMIIFPLLFFQKMFFIVKMFDYLNGLYAVGSAYV